MGEIADMMLEGILCEICGEYMGDGDGYPQVCGACGGSGDEPKMNKEKCPICGKRKANVQAHIDAVHSKGDEDEIR